MGDSRHLGIPRHYLTSDKQSSRNPQENGKSPFSRVKRSETKAKRVDVI